MAFDLRVSLDSETTPRPLCDVCSKAVESVEFCFERNVIRNQMVIFVKCSCHGDEEVIEFRFGNELLIDLQIGPQAYIDNAFRKAVVFKDPGEEWKAEGLQAIAEADAVFGEID